MRLLMVAPPGAGKGTQAQRLSARFGIEHISSGELLRREVAAGTATGRRAAGYLRSGDLVADEVVLVMVMDKVVAAARAGGYVLDGFPRTLAQAEAAYRWAAGGDAELQAVIVLQVEEKELRRRLLARARSEHRADDAPGTIEHRLHVYEAQTRPMLRLYSSRGIVRPVDGDGPVDSVTAAVVDVVKDLVPGR